MKHSVSDDEIERFIGERSMHQIRLNDAAILQLTRVFEGRECRIRNVEREHLARTIFGNEPRIEARPRTYFKHAILAAIKRLLCVQIGHAKLLAIPAKQKFLVF